MKRVGSIIMSEQRRANRLLAIVFSCMCIFLTVAYIIEYVKGTRSLSYLLVFLVLLYVPGVVNLFIQIRDVETKKTKYVLTFGYLVHFAFALATSTKITAFCYILPLVLVLTLMHDRRLLTILNTLVLIINLAKVGHNLFVLDMASDAEYVANAEIQIALLLLFAVFSVLTSKVDVEINTQKLNKIKKQEEDLKTIVNSMVDIANNINAVITEVNNNMDTLENASNSTVMNMEEITKGTTETAEAIQNQLVMTENIQVIIRKIKDTTADVNELSSKAIELVAFGKNNMKELNLSIERNNDNSKKTIEDISKLHNEVLAINEIIRIINDIAAQTNLLSLNASIEAARAGEQGKGFAIVADEIRKLADKTKESTVQIQELASTISSNTDIVSNSIQQFVNDTVQQNEIIKETEGNYNIIEDNIDHIKLMGNDLKDKVSDLHNSNLVIVDSVQTISGISEETMANTEQTENVSNQNLDIVRTMKTLSEELRELSGQISNINQTVNQ